MNFPIDACPKCGNTKIMRKERYKGIGYTIDTLAKNNLQAQQDMSDSANFFNDAEFTFISKWWCCSKCKKKLFTNDQYIEYQQ